MRERERQNTETQRHRETENTERQREGGWVGGWVGWVMVLMLAC